MHKHKTGTNNNSNHQNLFLKDIIYIRNMTCEKEQWDYIRTNICLKIMQDDAKYINNILQTDASNEYKKFIEFVGTNTYLDTSKRFFFLKSFLLLLAKLDATPINGYLDGYNLAENTKFDFTKELWSHKSFRDIFNLFVITCSDTSLKEKHTGPFCSMFSNNWKIPGNGDEFNEYNKSLTPLLKDTDTHPHILAYFNKFIELNSAYVDGNFEYIGKSCSTVDFNYTMIRILIEMTKYINTESDKTLQTTTYKAINVMHIPLVNILHTLYTQAHTANADQLKYTQLLITRLLTVYNCEQLSTIIHYRLPSIVEYMDTTCELKNMCMYILDKFKNNYSAPYLVQSVTKMKDFIVKNEIYDDTASIFLDISIKKVKINMDTCDTKKIINGILETFLKGDTEIVDNINAFFNLLSLFEEYGELSSNNHLTLHKMLKKMDILMSPTVDQFILSYKSSVLMYYLNISRAVLADLRTHDGWLEQVKRVLDSAVSIFVLFSLLNIGTEVKQQAVKILCECIILCELTNTESAILRIKLKSFITPELQQAIDRTLIYTDDLMMYDYLTPDKKLVNPIFIPIGDKDIVVDMTTLSTDKFKEFIEGKTTLSAITLHNNTPQVLVKKIELIGLLNSHVLKI